VFLTFFESLYSINMFNMHIKCFLSWYVVFFQCHMFYNYLIVLGLVEIKSSLGVFLLIIQALLQKVTCSSCTGQFS